MKLQNKEENLINIMNETRQQIYQLENTIINNNNMIENNANPQLLIPYNL